MISQINNFFKKTGIYKAKHVYIYSDFIKFFYLVKNPEKKIDEFLNLFLKRGITCIAPSFSYTKSGIFDICKANSKLGFLSNYLIKNKRYNRSLNPMFSFTAIGKNKNILSKVGKSAFGKNSLHDKLYKNNCYFLNFDRPLLHGNTLIHHIEQKNNSKYRFEKIFKTRVYKKNKYLGKNFKAFVRKGIKKNLNDSSFKKAFKLIKNEKYFKSKILKTLKITVYPYDAFYNNLHKLIKLDKEIFIINRKK